MIPGGEVRHGELNFTGPLTESSIRSLRFDTAVIGCCGLSAEHGMTAHDLSDVAVKQAAIASARRVVAATRLRQVRPHRVRRRLPPGPPRHGRHRPGSRPSEHDALTAAGVTVRLVPEAR